MKSPYPIRETSLLILDSDANEYRDLNTTDFSHSRDNDSVSADPKQYSTAPTNFTVGSTEVTLFTLATGDKGFIQNLGTGTIAVKKGSGASSSSFSFILKASNTENDGTGGSVNLNDWIGPVSVASGNGGQLRYIAWKVTPN